MEGDMEISLKTRNKTTTWPAIPLLGIYPEEAKIETDTCVPVFIAALFTIGHGRIIEHGSNLDVHRQMNG